MGRLQMVQLDPGARWQERPRAVGPIGTWHLGPDVAKAPSGPSPDPVRREPERHSSASWAGPVQNCPSAAVRLEQADPVALGVGERDVVADAGDQDRLT